MAESYKYVVGIDLGTTNTLACFFRNGRKELVKFAGEPLLPSVLYVDKSGKAYIGNKALNRGATDPRNMVRSSKKYIGDYEKEPWNLNGKKFTPTDVATEILKEVRANFVRTVDCDPSEKIGAVITVPAYFNNNQRNETRKAGQAAGFEVMWILEEPVAAAIEVIHEEHFDKKVFVVDIGGGTFDLSVLEADEQQHIYKEIDKDGDPQLGGDDFDEALVNRLIEIIKDDSGKDLSSLSSSGLEESDYHRKRNILLKAAQRAKKELSGDSEESDIEIEDLFDDYDLEMTLTREEFNSICGEIFDKIFARTKRFVDNSKEFKIDDIGRIILAGGTCYIPLIGETIEKMFGIEPDSDLEKSMLVAYGAAHFARWKNGGVESGIAFTLQGIIPHSLGVEIVNRKREHVFEKILTKGLKYPCNNSKNFTTTFDNQTQVDINVYEAGNDAEAQSDIKYHKLYGTLTLDGIAPKPKGVPTIKVTFDYDDNQRLTVTALDTQTGDSETKAIKSGQKVEQKKESPVDLMLLLDISGSISSSDLSQAKSASLRLVNEMIDLSVHRMGIISFDSYAHLLCHLTHDKNQLKQVIDNVRYTGGSTDMVDAFRKSENELRSSVNEKIVLMMTDGYPDNREMTLEITRKLTRQGFQIYAIGVGRGTDPSFLKQMAGNKNALAIDSMSKLADAFKSVMNSIMLR
ncbi:MAG: Hsp70 family protein [Selenomonadaceae bacterium]|nr:Hsp70 family protein [Selenomonadaceae bacterium]